MIMPNCLSKVAKALVGWIDKQLLSLFVHISSGSSLGNMKQIHRVFLLVFAASGTVKTITSRINAIESIFGKQVLTTVMKLSLIKRPLSMAVESKSVSVHLRGLELK